MAQDPRIDAYIAKAGEFARPVLNHLRQLVHATIPELDETIKWGFPHFTFDGKNLAGMSAFKAHAAFMIHGDGRQGDAMGQFGKLTQLSDLPSDAELAAKLCAARDRILNGERKVRKPAPAKLEIPMPDDFAAALSVDARTLFDGFAPSHRREYLEWVTEAKRPETRASRIVQAAEWIAEGKKRNWKYESC